MTEARATRTPRARKPAAPKAEKELQTVEAPQTPGMSPTEQGALMLQMLATMQQQVALQNEVLAKVLARENKTIEEVYPAPPAATTIDQSGEAINNVGNDTGPTPLVSQKFKPGEVIPDGYTKDGIPYGKRWRAWTKEDLDPNDTITFVPVPVPGLVYPIRDDQDRQKIMLTVNGLVCWLTCNELNTVNKFFYNAYKDALDFYNEAQAFKRVGGPGPWMAGGRHGENTWKYTPVADTFGMDDEGRPLGAQAAWDNIFAEASELGSSFTDQQ